jgi:hypothetical protein
MWQFHNHMFEVTDPTPSDTGYASFIPRPASGHVIKRKRFTQDGFARYETKTIVTDELTTVEAMLSPPPTFAFMADAAAAQSSVAESKEPVEELGRRIYNTLLLVSVAGCTIEA